MVTMWWQLKGQGEIAAGNKVGDPGTMGPPCSLPRALEVPGYTSATGILFGGRRASISP